MKEQVLELLQQHAGTTVSGAKMAETLDISRVMIHKYIESLRKDGYNINAQEGRGYVMTWPEGELNPARAKTLIKGEFGRSLVWRSRVTSTQDEILLLNQEDKIKNCGVLVAREQSAGKGRRGRSWVAEPGGLWFSLFLITDVPLVAIPRLSLVFCLALVNVLKSWWPEVTIKWPNDIMVQGNKLGGLLLNLQGEANDTSKLVVGVGINVNCQPPLLDIGAKQAATSLKYLRGETAPIDEIFAAILESMESFYNSYRSGNWDNIISEYRSLCAHVGQTITVHHGQDTVTGINTAITDEGSLELSVQGSRLVLHSGDIM